jgi:hypothetical protein
MLQLMGLIEVIILIGSFQKLASIFPALLKNTMRLPALLPGQ